MHKKTAFLQPIIIIVCCSTFLLGLYMFTSNSGFLSPNLIGHANALSAPSVPASSPSAPAVPSPSSPSSGSPSASPEPTPVILEIVNLGNSSAELEIKDLKLKKDNNILTLEWTKISDDSVNYKVESLKEDSSKIAEALFSKGKVFTGSVGTFTEAKEQKADDKKYFLALMPKIFKKNDQILTFSPTNTVSYIFDKSAISSNHIYLYWLTALKDNKIVAYSKEAIIFDGAEFNPAALPFKDVPPTIWYYPFVRDLFEKKIFDSAENFFPDRKLNRAEAVKIIIKAINVSPTEEDRLFADKTFSDVKSTDWFAPFVGYMAKKGWVQGVKKSNGEVKFMPNENLNRAQMLKLISLAYDFDPSQYSNVSNFLDVPSSIWFAPYVEYARVKGIIELNTEKMFFPARDINRAEIAKIISIAIKVLSK